MPVWLGLLAVTPLLMAAWLIGRAPDAGAARRYGLAGAALAFATTLLAYAWDVLALTGDRLLVDVPGWSGWPAAICGIGIVAVAGSPQRHLAATTVGHILQVTALSLLAVAVRHPVAAVALTAATMVPVWLELGSRPETLASARLFGWYMVPSALLMLVGGVLYAVGLEGVAMPLLGSGILIRAALLPGLRWLPDLATKAPLGLVTVLVAPQLGLFALMRLITLGVSQEALSLLAVVGALTALYAAVRGVCQRRIRPALGYLLTSQGGLVVLGVTCAGPRAWTGTLMTALVSGVTAAGLVMAVAALEGEGWPLVSDRPMLGFADGRWLVRAFLVLGLAGAALSGSLGCLAGSLSVSGLRLGWPVVSAVLLLTAALNGISVVTSGRRLATGQRA